MADSGGAVRTFLLVLLGVLAAPGCAMAGSTGTCEARGDARCWYVAADATGGGDGSFERPFRVPQDAVDRAGPGDFVYLRGGVEFTQEHATGRFLFATHPRCCRDGRPDAIITVKSYPGEQAVSRGALALDGNLDVVLSRSYWRVEGLRIIHGVICVACQFVKGVEHVWVIGNHVSDAVAPLSNFGLIRVHGDQRPNPGHPKNIVIRDNVVHTLWYGGEEGVLAWSDDPDVEHHACLTIQHASGLVEIIDNEMYECASIFYFKYDGPGPVTVSGNRLHHAKSMGQWRSSKTTFRNNVVHDVRRGLWVRWMSAENVLESNTFVGLDPVVTFDAIDTQTLRGNVFFGSRWVAGSGDFAAASSDENCFLATGAFSAYGERPSRPQGGRGSGTPVAGSRPQTRRPGPAGARPPAGRGQDRGTADATRPAATGGAGQQRDTKPYTLEQVRARFGQERQSVHLFAADPAGVFRDPAAADYTMIGRAAVQCEGRGAP